MAEKSADRLALEKKADELGLKYPPNIGDVKLQEKIAAEEDNAPGGVSDDEIRGKTAGMPALRVTGPKRGRWRIGRKFTPEAQDLDPDELKTAEIKAIVDDPLLTVIGVGVTIEELIEID